MKPNRSLLSITEMAKFRNITTETLRYYDRIGLFKPEYVDPETNYRYYSVMQYEKLGTIKELRQLDMSLEEIRDYFTDRNLKKSIDILSRQHGILQRKLEELAKLEKALSKKMSFLGDVMRKPRASEIEEKDYPERQLITTGSPVDNVQDLAFAITGLENNLDEIAPILATNRVGGIITKEIFNTRDMQFAYIPMILCNKTSVKKPSSLGSLPKGKYVCMRYTGRLGHYYPEFYPLFQYIKSKDYHIESHMCQIFQIDVTLTSNFSETAIEIQIPVQ